MEGDSHKASRLWGAAALRSGKFRPGRRVPGAGGPGGRGLQAHGEGAGAVPGAAWRCVLGSAVGCLGLPADHSCSPRGPRPQPCSVLLPRALVPVSPPWRTACPSEVSASRLHPGWWSAHCPPKPRPHPSALTGLTGLRGVPLPRGLLALPTAASSAAHQAGRGVHLPRVGRAPCLSRHSTALGEAGPDPVLTPASVPRGGPHRRRLRMLVLRLRARHRAAPAPPEPRHHAPHRQDDRGGARAAGPHPRAPAGSPGPRSHCPRPPLQVSKSACVLTTQAITRLLKSKEATATVDIRTWPTVLDTGACARPPSRPLASVVSARGGRARQLRGVVRGPQKGALPAALLVASGLLLGPAHSSEGPSSTSAPVGSRAPRLRPVSLWPLTPPLCWHAPPSLLVSLGSAATPHAVLAGQQGGLRTPGPCALARRVSLGLRAPPTGDTASKQHLAGSLVTQGARPLGFQPVSGRESLPVSPGGRLTPSAGVGACRWLRPLRVALTSAVNGACPSPPTVIVPHAHASGQVRTA